MWVPLVENNEHLGSGADYFIEKNVKHLLDRSDQIDAILLACTHYPLLATKIEQFLPAGVRLIAVTKQVPVDAMREAYLAGVRDFGESRLQEAEAKIAQLKDLPDLNWHLIGHLQSNKAKKALEQFQWIHSCDNLKLAQRLNRLANKKKNKSRTKSN